MEETKPAVPDTATEAPAQAPAVESGQTATPVPETVPLSTHKAALEELEALKNQQKKAQSEQDKRKAKLLKEYRKELDAIKTMAPREDWDEQEQKRRRDAVTDEYSRRSLEAEVEDEAADEAPTPRTDVPSPQSFGLDSVETARLHLQRELEEWGLTDKQLPLDPYLQPVHTPEEYAAMDKKFKADLRKAYDAHQKALQTRAGELKEQVEAERVAETVAQYGGLGGNDIGSGAPDTARARNKTSLNVDWETILTKQFDNKKQP